jgi:hypothetical protein
MFDRVWVAIPMAILAVGLAGCAAPPAPEPTPTPTRMPVALTLRDLPDGTVIGTGTFTGVMTETSGHIDITVENGVAVASLVDLEIAMTIATDLVFSPYSLPPDRLCIGDAWHLDVGSIGASPTVQVGAVTEGQGDPGFLATAVITQTVDEPSEDCLGPIVAIAPLTWTLPDMRPGLEVDDSGNRRGAEGSVTVVDGEPATYTVVPRDDAEAIAVRFGITVADLDYLNPAREPLREDPLLYIGEELNLDRDER